MASNQEFASQGVKGIGDRENLDWHKYILENAKRKVKLLGCTLQHWQTKSEDLIIKRIEDNNDHLVIQILLLNPWSDICRKRGKSPVIDSQGEDFKRDVISHIQWYLQVGEKIRRKNFELIPTKFDVRLYNSLPYCSLMLRDDVINLGVYLENTRGTKTMYFEIAATNKENDFFTKLEDHFDICWKNAVSIFSNGSEMKLSEIIKDEVGICKEELNDFRKEITLITPKAIYLNSSFRQSLKDGPIADELRKKLEEEGCFLSKDAKLTRKSSNMWTLEVAGQFRFRSILDSRNGLIEDTGTQINVCFPQM